MTSLVFLIALFVTILTLCSAELNLEDIQKKIQQNADDVVLLSKNVQGWNDNLPKYFRGFLENSFKKYIGDEPIFVYQLTFTESWSQFGNRLGHYFEALTLAKFAGVHFVGFKHNGENPAEKLLEALPVVVKHPNPVSREQAIINMKELTKSDKYNIEWPWTKPGAQSFNNIKEIGELTRKISDKMESMYNTHNHLKNETFDMVLNDKGKTVFPYIPYAAILTRCSDLIRAGHFDEYGFLNFNVYTMTIPADATEIYVLAEPLNYGNSEGAKLCKYFVDHLVHFIHEKFPNAVVGLRRGQAHHGFVQLSKAKVVVCSPSTFCFWPGIANTENKVYYQPSQLVASGTEIFLHKNFHWISYPKMFTYMMTEEDAKNPESTALAMATMAKRMDPKCEHTEHDKNSAKDIDHWDCNKFKFN